MLIGRLKACLIALFLAVSGLYGSPRALAASTKLDARLRVQRATARRPIAAAAVSRPAEPSFRVLLEAAPGVTIDALRAAYPSAHFGSAAGPIITATVPDSILAAFESDPRVLRVEGSRRYHPVLDVVRSNAQQGGLYLGTTRNAASADLANADGAGVIVGIVDTGIDFRHRDFISTTTNSSRILYIWDQNAVNATPPSFPPGFSCTINSVADECHTTQWTQAQMTSDIQNHTTVVHSSDTNGHGTHVAGIAAGNGQGGSAPGTYVGMAPKADIIFVATDFSTPGIIDGINYIAARANQLHERAVINLSLGGQIDPHDGTSAFDVAVAAVAASTPVVVAMGNDGAAIGAFPHARMASLAFHQNLTFNVSVAGVYTRGSEGSSADIDFWKQTADSYTVSVTVAGSGCGAVASSSGSALSCSGHSVFVENANGGSTVVNPLSPDGSTTSPNNEIYVQVYNPDGSKLPPSLNVAVTFTCANPSGCGQVDGFVDAEGEDTVFAPGSGYATPSALTMSSPATANNVFAVGSYASKTTWTGVGCPSCSYGDGSAAGNISTFSGWGPTRDGRPKPDVAAPGDVIVSTLSGDVVPGSAASSFSTQQVLASDGAHAVLAGTSMATPVVAGILAARLQSGPSRTVAQLRTIVQGLARSDSAVTNSASYYNGTPYSNNGWNDAFGAGKVVASPQPISAPTGLAAAFVGISSITWSWNPTTISADAYDLYYASNPAVPVALAVQPPYTQTGLAANTSYGIVVKGVGAGIEGPGATLTNVTTNALAGPQNVAAGAVGISSVSWTWSAALSAVSYNVYSSIGGLLANVVATSFVYSNLPSNTPVFVTIRSVDGSGNLSPAATAPTSSTLASPVTGTPVAAAFISSIAVSFTPCPASPASASCEGYLLNASTAPDFSGTVFFSSTANNAASLLQVSGLSPLTTYYLSLATLNGTGGADPVSLAPTETTTNILAPVPSSAMTIASTTITFNWSRGSNPAGLTYSADASPSAVFAPPVVNVSGTDIFSAAFTGLAVNTTYYMRVRAGAGPYLSTGPVSTLAVPPAAASPPFTGVTVTQLTANWTLGADPAGTAFLAQLSTASDFSGALVPVAANGTSAVFSGLVSNTSYYLRVQAVGNGGIGSAFLVLPATSTLAQPVTLAAQPFGAQQSGGFTASFLNSGGNAAGTLYLAAISTDPGFSAAAVSVVTTNTYAAYAGLAPNTTYYFEAAAFNNSGALSSFSAIASTVTLPALPAAAAALASAQTASGLRMSWGAGGNPAPTLFTAQVSSDPAFGGAPASSTTANLYADFAGLLSNTTYYLRVKALSLGPPDPDSSFASLGAAATLANPPGAPAAPFVSVTYGSVTVQWIGLPAAPSSAAAEGYLVQASTDPAFGGRLFASAAYGAGALLGGVSGLASSTTYYLRVGSLNWNGVPDFTVLGPAATLAPVQSTQTVSLSGASVTAVPVGSPLKSIRADIPAGVFPAGTVVTLNTSVQLDLPPPQSNEGRITALAGGAGFSLTAGGLQPSGPVLVTLSYDPLSLPAGADPKQLQLARYDDAAGQWTFLPTYVDTRQNTLTAPVSHFSFYATFLVAASASVDDVNIFPIPWEPGSGDAVFDAPALTFSNLPEDAAVSLFNLKGELLWKSQASPNGILTWDGKSRFGRNAASGTYLVVIESGGKRVTRRVAVIR